MQIKNLADKNTVSRKKVLASLEAEVSREVDAVYQIIRNYSAYEFILVEELSEESYAKYLKNLHLLLENWRHAK